MPTPTPTPSPTPTQIFPPTPTPTPGPTGLITIHRRVTVTTDDRFRLQAWVDEASDGLDPAIFLHRQTPPVPGGTDLDVAFISIVTFHEWHDYHVDAPQASTGYFRSTSADLIFTSLTDLNQVWQQMKDDLETLIRVSDDLQLSPVDTNVYDMEL